MPEMTATLKGRALGGFGRKARSSPSGGLAEYRWQGEEPRRLLGAKLGGGGSLVKNSLRGESDIPGSSVGCSRVSIEPARGRLFPRGRAPHSLASLEHGGHWPAPGLESMPLVRLSSPAPFHPVCEDSFHQL